MKFLRLTRGIALAALLALGGCSSIGNLHKADNDIAQGDRQARSYIKQMGQVQAAPAATPTVEISNKPWVDTEPMHIVNRRIPPDLSCAVTFRPVGSMDLLQFAQQITQDCKIPVRVTPDALKAIGGLASGAAPPAGVTIPNLPTLPALNRAGAAGGATMSEDATVPVTSPVPAGGTLSGISDYVGSVAGLLDLVTTRNGLSWRYDEFTHSIAIFYLDTRTFRIDAFPTVTHMQSMIQTGTMTTEGGAGGAGGGMGGGGGGGGMSGGGSGGGGVSGMAGSSQTTRTTMDTSLYKDLAETIKSFLTPNVGRIAVSASTGTVSVTDTPEVLSRIGQLLRSENATLTKQIIFHTKILAITLDANDEVGLNWDAFDKVLSGKLGVSFKTPVNAAATAGTLGASVIGTSPFSGSNVVLSALSTLGNVRTITSPTVATLNLQPAPVQIARQIGYIASAQAPLESGTSGAVAPGGLSPGFVTVGFSMSLVPRLLEDNRQLIVQYSIDISSLNQLRSVSAAGTTIEFPDVDQRKFSDQVRLRSGETLMLHGFEQDTSTSNRQGMGSPFAWMLGGNMKGERQREEIVILITPEVVPSQPVASAP